MREAAYYQPCNDLITCQLCPNRCQIGEGQKGRCLSRGVSNGRMLADSYGTVVAANLDPIEKKPLYHFFPGKKVYSIGSYGCNLHCRFCQNADISQNIQNGTTIAPPTLVNQALSFPDNAGVAFTYNEPGIWYEYISDCAPLLRAAGLATIMVTNGYLCRQPWNDLCKIVDAMNIDLKSFNPVFYQNICGGDLETVKNNIISALDLGVHVELTHLVVTGLNDNIDEFSAMIAWLSALDSSIPLHISRYFPRYRETSAATAPETIEKFVTTARKSLKYVYPGNIAADQNTCCPECRQLWVSRTHYHTLINHTEPLCSCGYPLPGNIITPNRHTRPEQQKLTPGKG